MYYVCVCVYQKSAFHVYFFICVHVLNLHANFVIIISLFLYEQTVYHSANLEIATQL